MKNVRLFVMYADRSLVNMWGTQGGGWPNVCVLNMNMANLYSICCKIGSQCSGYSSGLVCDLLGCCSVIWASEFCMHYSLASGELGVQDWLHCSNQGGSSRCCMQAYEWCQLEAINGYGIMAEYGSCKCCSINSCYALPVIATMRAADIAPIWNNAQRNMTSDFQH